MGKSALATNIAENAAVDARTPVALFSLEMSETELAHRFPGIAGASVQRRVAQGSGQGGPLAEGQLCRQQALAEAPLYIDDSSTSGCSTPSAKACRLANRHGLGLVIVDYLQLMRPDGRSDSRVEQIGQISRGLKILAREPRRPGDRDLGQLSRAVESRNPPVPTLSDLRESGSIEQDADVVMFVYRDEYYNRESERLGEAGSDRGQVLERADRRDHPLVSAEIPEVREPSIAIGAPYRSHRPRATGARREQPAPADRRLAGRLPRRRMRRQHLGARRGEQRGAPLPLSGAKGAPGGERRGRHGHRAAIPRGLIRARADRLLDSLVLRQVRSFVREIDNHLEAGRGPGSTGRSALARPRSRSCSPKRPRTPGARTPSTRAAAARGDQAHLRPRRQQFYLGFFRRLCSVDLLVLDDLGAEKQTEWVLEQLYSIVNERWQDRRLVVVTTNIPDPDPESAGRMLHRARASCASESPVAGSSRMTSMS